MSALFFCLQEKKYETEELSTRLGESFTKNKGAKNK
jgi:hypothetical protein